MRKLKELTAHPVIAGILILLIGSISYATFVEKLNEYIDNIIKSLFIIYSFIIDIFTYKIALYQIAIFLLLVIILYSKSKKDSEDRNKITTTKKENDILQILATEYGKENININQIATRLRNKNMLLLEQEIENLQVNKQLIIEEENYFDGITLTLTKLGRNYVLSNKDLFKQS